MLALAAAATYSGALTHGPLPERRVTRRSAAAAIFAMPALGVWTPERAAALFGIGGDGPQGEFRQLEQTRMRLADLAKQLETNELDGDKADDAIVVLQTLTIQFGGTAKLLAKTTEGMDLLDAKDLARANELAARVAQEFEAVRQGCRDKSARMQLDGVKGADGALEQYLAVASTKYTLPTVAAPLQYSKDSREFAKQYYGIFSCEGQGLERVKGSNTCKASKTDKNINPFPTKQFLDFDFLTGEKLDIKN